MRQCYDAGVPSGTVQRPDDACDTELEHAGSQQFRVLVLKHGGFDELPGAIPI